MITLLLQLVADSLLLRWVIFVLIGMKILSEKRIELSQTITSLFSFIKDGEGMSALRLAGQMRIDGLRGRYGNCTTVATQLSR